MIASFQIAIQISPQGKACEAADSKGGADFPTQLSDVTETDNGNSIDPSPPPRVRRPPRRGLPSRLDDSLQSYEVRSDSLEGFTEPPSVMERLPAAPSGEENLHGIPPAGSEFNAPEFPPRRPFDTEFCLSLLNPTEIFCPVNARKIAHWCGYGLIAAGIWGLDRYTQTFPAIGDAIRYNSTAVLTIMYGTEPVMCALNLLIAQYPEAVEPIDEESRIIPTPGAEDIALVIPCHRSAAVIGGTLRAALHHLKPEQIFVIDNANTKTPPDNTREVVAAIDRKINYVWVPRGNKVVAQYAGSQAAKDFKYILTTDDDVTIPTNFDFGTDLMSEQVKAVCYPVRAIPGDGKSSLLVEWQDLEYAISDLSKAAEDAFGGVLYPHGAGSLWDRETFLEVLRRHDTIFYADDVKMGLILQDLRKSMKICATSFLSTEAPTTLFGNNPPNLYQQRVRSWDMGRHVYFLKFLRTLGKHGPHRTFTGHAYIKTSEVLTVLSSVIDYLRVPVIVVLVAEPTFWVKTAAFTVIGVVPNILWNYVKVAERPDLQSTLRAVSTVWIYKTMESAISVASILRTFVVYLPNAKHKPTIRELERDNDPCCVWLKPDSSSEGAGDNAAQAYEPAPFMRAN